MIINGDARKEVKKLSNVQTIITSPPYFNLRDYDCENQIGLENNVDDYLKELKEVFEACYEVLNKDGLLFVNIDDTYYYPRPREENKWGKAKKLGTFRPGIDKDERYKISSLMAIPEKMVLMLMDIGYIFRQRIVWQKPSCMPESVTNRFTKDFEMIYMFSKSKDYKFNQLKEPMLSDDLSRPRGSKGSLKAHSGSGVRKEQSLKTEYVRNMRSVWSITGKNTTEHRATFPDELAKRLIECSTDENDKVLDLFAGSFTTSSVAKKLNRKYV
ncbi:site-specific DNA-methyltransferase, partial [Erysipelotrichaceae bacterium OttesenSCG-928-M19]|nr:site-specific DNA-methyltransferase [Erysipelotrichaceae bacterium OttesenSCG-928-M19]